MGKRHEVTKELVREAIADLKAGRVEDGLLTLERAVDPKWDSHAECFREYREATAVPV